MFDYQMLSGPFVGLQFLATLRFGVTCLRCTKTTLANSYLMENLAWWNATFFECVELSQTKGRGQMLDICLLLFVVLNHT